jgi:hypothetical protein
MRALPSISKAAWPDLGKLNLLPTTETLHLWTQVVGKFRLMTTPWENHSWHVPLYVSTVGLTTGLMHVAGRGVTLEFNFIDSELQLRDSDGGQYAIPLHAQSVAAFYAATMDMLHQAGIFVPLNAQPCEIQEAIAFHDDHAERTYEPDTAHHYWKALIQIQRVFQQFRTRFVGKCSPIHLFWGAFDLAVTRFSGRPAPLHPGGAPFTADTIMQEAYEQEVSSAGFWPGGGLAPSPCFYSYAYPAPDGFAKATVPSPGYYDDKLGEFLLSYDAVANSDDPDATLMTFLQTTYELAADLGHWNRPVLERTDGPIGSPPSRSRPVP